MTSPPAKPVPAPGKRSVRLWDVLLTSLLLLADAALALSATVGGLYVATAADACGAIMCDPQSLAGGMVIATVLPWVLLLAAIVVSIVRLVMRRLAFWVPIAGAGAIGVAYLLGAGLISAIAPLV